MATVQVYCYSIAKILNTLHVLRLTQLSVILYVLDISIAGLSLILNSLVCTAPGK